MSVILVSIPSYTVCGVIIEHDQFFFFVATIKKGVFPHGLAC